MTQAAPRSSASSPAASPPKPFIGLIDSVIVESTGDFIFEGAIAIKHAQAAWTWMIRDVAPDLLGRFSADATAKDLETVLPEVLARARKLVADAAKSQGDDKRRLVAQLGGEESYGRIALVLVALKSRPLLEQARVFGRAVNNIADEKGIVAALQSMPLQDSMTAALIMQAAVGQMANPMRLVAAAIRIAGHANEASLTRAGYGPLIDAILAHAQSLVPGIQARGAYADMDLVCSTIERFHKLFRSVNGYIELSRGGRWASIVSAMTAEISSRLEPRLREVVPDVNQSLRKPRGGSDRFDNDRVLSALSGLYLLTTIRDCRDSLALNAVFDQAWSDSGQVIESHIARDMQAYRDNPQDTLLHARLDAGIKMAELRFGAEYAEVLRKGRDAAARRAG